MRAGWGVIRADPASARLKPGSDSSTAYKKHHQFVREEVTMKPASIRAFTVCVGLVAATFAAIQLVPSASGQTGPGWVMLFDGKSLGDWDRVGEANWRVEDGAIVADKLTSKGSAHLVTKSSYKDFMIHAEFWASDDANSGIFIRCSDPKTITAKNSYEVNIFDQRKDPSYGTGGIVYFAEVNPMPKAGGKWNTFEITAKGRNIVVVLNGQKTVDMQNGLFEEGPFTLQYGSGVIKFRKVAVKPL
jgi:Domain of Unknown Function (DUF1080)